MTHAGGPLLVLGGAGTGKTRVLTRHFAWLVAEGAPPDGVLALVFSPAAAAEMRERLEALIDAPWEELWVDTFQTFCTRLLQDEALEAGLDPFFSPVTPADRLALLHDRIEDLTLRRHEIRGNPAPLLASFIARIDRLKDEMVGAQAYAAWATRLVENCREADDADRAHAQRELEFAKVYADHDRLLAESGSLDFGDLVLHAFRLLHEKPHVRARVAARFRHVLVDEFQEVNFAQGALLRLLCQDNRNVAVAADDDQAIHRFRSASRKNVLEFEREYGDCVTVKLEQSHRCSQRILQAAGAVVAGGGERIEKRLRGSRGGHVAFWRCRSERGQAQAVAAECERLITQQGVPPEEICVLVHSVRDDGPTISAALEERAVPFRLRVRPPTSSAPRCATCSPGCGCWQTPRTPAPWCGPCRARRSSCARWTSRGSRSSRAAAGSTWWPAWWPHATGRSSRQRGATERWRFCVYTGRRPPRLPRCDRTPSCTA